MVLFTCARYPSAVLTSDVPVSVCRCLSVTSRPLNVISKCLDRSSCFGVEAVLDLPTQRLKEIEAFT